MRVKGQGPIPSSLMFVGEGPGQLESQTGVPFHPKAPAGAELTRYLNGYDLPKREDVYITNLVKEWEGGVWKKKQDVTPDDIARDEGELQAELTLVTPSIVCTLGRHATHWFLGGKPDMDACHGLLFRRIYCLACGQIAQTIYDVAGTPCPSCGSMATDYLFVLPCFHPAAGLHQSDQAAKTAYDLAQLASILKQPASCWPNLAWKPGALGQYYWVVEAAKHDNPCGDFGVDSEGTPDKPWSLQIAPKPGWGVVGLPETLGPALAKAFGWGTPVFHFAMVELQMFAALGIPWPEQFHDTGLMAYVLGLEPQALKDLAFRHLGLDLPTYSETVGHWVQQFTKSGKPCKGKNAQKWVLRTLDDIPKQQAVNYAGADPDVTLRLKPILWQKIVSQGLEQVYELDRQMLPVYARMEMVGLPVNEQHFQEFGAFLAEDLEIRTWILQHEFGDQFNPGNSDHVAEILFGQLGLPGAKKTPVKQRFSTNDKILQSLKGQHPVVEAIIDWREVQKLKTTFVDQLPEYCRPGLCDDLRLYYKLLPTRVVSGRLAAKDPNVLALPKHSELGKRFRAGIQAPGGRLLGSWDFDQIELRVLALDSGSPTLREIFGSGQDLHARTAFRIFGVPPHQQDKSLHRLPAKAVNFGIPMGMTEMGLAEQYRKNGYPWPELKGVIFESQKDLFKAQAEVCRQHIQTVIDEWQIEGYLEEKRAQARRFGYVTDCWGRRRYLANVSSPNKHVAEEACRMAQSFPIQAGARGFYKTVVAKVWQDVIRPLQAEGYYIEPLLDIHDDLLLEFQDDMADWLNPLIESYFNGTFQLTIPITCKGSIGARWSDL